MPSISRVLASLSSTTRILAARISAEVTIRPNLFDLHDFLRREFQRLFERSHELSDLDGFGQIPEKSSLQTFFDIARHGVGAEGDYGDVCRHRVRAEDLESFDAADAGKIDVHENHVRLVGACQLDAQVSVPGAE